MRFDGQRIPQSELNKPVRRHIKRKEKMLGKQCMKVWKFTNRLDEQFLFGRFGLLKDKNHTIVTLAAYSERIHAFLTMGC